MATSGSYDFASSRDLIIENAYRLVGALGENETLSTTQKNLGHQFLNPMIKHFSTMGMPIWADETISINMSQWATGTPTIAVSNATASVTYKPLKLLGAWRRDNTTATDPSDVPLQMYTKDEYQALPNKLEESVPVGVYFLPTRTSSTVTLWPIPDSTWRTNGILRLRVQREFQDFDAAADEPDFPIEWVETLTYQLAVRLAPQYGLAPTDRQMLEAKAKELLADNLGFDQEEGSLFIKPAWRW